MTTPHFKTHFSDNVSANVATSANNALPISKISEISRADTANALLPLTIDHIYRYQERVAIMMFDGGVTKSEAETLSLIRINHYADNTGS